MTSYYLASALLGSVLMTLIILLEVRLWQRKEYRWDRMQSFLLTPEWRSLGDVLLTMFAGLVGMGWLLYLADRLPFANVIGGAALLVLAGRYLRLYLRAGVHRPDLTQKGILALVLSTGMAIGLLFFTIMGTEMLPLQLATALLLLPAGIAVAIGATNGIAGARKRALIARAARLRKSQKPRVIAITGSVGKTSVKEYTAHILGQAGKRVAATKAHRNSEFTVAQDILEQLPAKPQVYIVEAAAYRRGEVAAIAHLTLPHVGVITAITNQHEALFGSLSAIADAKWELTKVAKKLVLNVDNAILAKRASKTKRGLVGVSVKEEADIFASNSKVEPENITCTIHIGKEHKRMTLPLVGDGALVSALLAAGAAYALDVSPTTIFTALKTLPALPRTMHVHTGKGGWTVLDDSYSASEASVKNAVEHLQRFPQKDKQIVMVPLIELSESAKAVHETIGRMLSSAGAHVHIFGNAYREDIARGAGEKTDITWYTSPKQLQGSLLSHLRKSSVVLLEGRVPDMVRRTLISA